MKRTSPRRVPQLLCALLLLTVTATAAAQDEMPADANIGTRIIGERETAAGLIVSPWKEAPTSAIGHAPRPYDVPLQPLDVQRFRRLADYDQAAREYAREQQYRAP
jgi:hypothetical protein